MGNDSELSIIVRARNEASKVLHDVMNDAKGVGSTISNGFKNAVPASAALAAGVAAAGAATVAFGVSSVNAYMEAENASAQLEAVIKSTGSAAGLTAKDLQSQATALQSVTKFSDEAVMATQSMLLTFTQIKGPVMQQATEAALDMAQALGMEGSQAAMQLGKALNDPAAGMAKLQRVGVTFTDSQKKAAEAMVAAGDVAGAQKLILEELSKEFGGSAVAAGQTFSGQMEILKNQFGDLQEAVGQAIMTGLRPLMDAFGGVIDKMNEAGGIAPFLTNIFKENQKTIAMVAGAIAVGLIPALVHAAGAMLLLFGPLVPFLAVGAALGFLLNKLAQHLGGWGPIIDVAKAAFSGLVSVVEGAIGVLKSIYDFFANNKLALAALAGAILSILIPALIGVAVALGGVVVGLAATAIAAVAAMIPFLPLIALGAALGAIAYLIITNWDTLKQWFSTAMTTIGGWISALTNNIQQWFSNAVNFVVGVWNGFVAIVTTIFAFIGSIIQMYINTYISIFQGIIGGVSAVFNGAANIVRSIWGGIIGFFSGIVGGIRSAVSGVFDAIAAPFNRAVDFVRGIPGRIVGALGNIGRIIRDTLGNFDIPGPLGKVRDVIPGFATGVRNFSGGLAVVGERGPELVNLPRGSDVFTNGDSKRMMGGATTVTNQFYGNIRIDTPEAADRFFDRLNRDAELASLGVPT